MTFHRRPGMPRQIREILCEKFAQLIVAGVRPTDAYRQAGYKASSDDAARASADKLLTKMQSRIAEIMGLAEVGNRAQQTLNLFQQDAAKCRQKLHELMDDKECPHSVRFNAVKLCLGYALGLPVQYVEQNVNVRYQITDQPMSEAEWAKEFDADIIGPGSKSTH